MIHKITSLLLQDKRLIQRSLYECPTSSSYHLSQALPISSSITPPPLSLLCKGTFHNSSPFFSLLVEDVYLSSPGYYTHKHPVPNMSAHMKVSLGRPRTGSLRLLGTHNPRHTQNTTASKVLGVSLPCPFSFLQDHLSPQAHLLKACFAIICSIGCPVLYEK